MSIFRFFRGSYWKKETYEKSEEVIHRESKGRNVDSNSSERRISLEDFFRSLPKMESHYCRNRTKKYILSQYGQLKKNFIELTLTNGARKKIQDHFQQHLFLRLLMTTILAFLCPKKTNVIRVFPFAWEIWILAHIMSTRR